MIAKPYIGITGCKTLQDVQNLSQICKEENAITEQRTVMFGYLTSSKRLEDPTKTGNRSPAVIDLPKLTQAAPQGSLPMLHYFATNSKDVLEENIQLFDNVYDSCKAVQLNVAWPNPKHLNTLLEEFPEMQIVLQLPKRATEGKTHEELRSRLQEYNGLAAYTLIDPSGGLGKSFADKDIELMHLVHETTPSTTVGIAGGLNKNNVYNQVKKIQQTFKHPFFIDAESSVMTNNQLDPQKERAYLKAGAEAFEF